MLSPTRQEGLREYAIFESSAGDSPVCWRDPQQRRQRRKQAAALVALTTVPHAYTRSGSRRCEAIVVTSP